MDSVQRRTDQLIVREVEGETVVYDTASEMVTVLDAETAAVWQAADGAAPIEAIASSLELSQEKVEVALVRLGDAGLLKAAMSRRTLLRGAGAAVAAGGLLTIMAPAPAFAASNATLTITKAGCKATAPTTTILATFTATNFDPNQTILVNYSYTPVGGGTAITGSVSITIGANGSGTATAELPNTSGKNISVSATTSEPRPGTATSRTFSAGPTTLQKCL